MIPDCLVENELKTARKIARNAASQIEKDAGCLMVAVVALRNPEDEGRAVTSMAVSPCLEDDPESEIVLMKCALARIMSLVVLHLGPGEALDCAVRAVAQGCELARLAEDTAP